MLNSSRQDKEGKESNPRGVHRKWLSSAESRIRVARERMCLPWAVLLLQPCGVGSLSLGLLETAASIEHQGWGVQLQTQQSLRAFDHCRYDFPRWKRQSVPS